MGNTRDYYADLELPPTADVSDIRKQFRKLALKYHPDRNPGRESEVNAQFQIIQTAHEVLADPQQKAKYDASRGPTSRYPAASGVRGNPWANVGEQFPAPPRRNNRPGRSQPTGAQRWQERFSAGVPPTAKQHHNADQQAKKTAAQAFENMRKGGTSQASKPPQRDSRNPAAPPPTPPRTQGARQRAEASFGSRKTSGYHSRPAQPSDEATGRPQSYHSGTASSRPVPKPPNISVPKPQPYTEIPVDSRHSTPYVQHGGEKTNPFDGVPLGRTKSTRDHSSREGYSSSEERRYAEANYHSANSGHDSNQSRPTGSGNPGRGDSHAHSYEDVSSTTKAEPTQGWHDSLRGSQSANDLPSETPSGHGQQHTASNGDKRPSMYGKFHKRSSPLEILHRETNCLYYCQELKLATEPEIWSSHNTTCLDTTSSSSTPSGVSERHYLTPYELEQHRLIDHLIRNQKDYNLTPSRQHTTASSTSNKPKNFANSFCFDSFEYPPQSAAQQPPPGSSDFSRSSTDDINTKFSTSDGPAAWQFSAGGDGSPSIDPLHPPGQQSPQQSPVRPSTEHGEETDGAGQPSGPEGGFNPEGWSDQFGPQTFIPPRDSAPSASPSRSSRKSSRRAKTAKPTAGSAAVLEESDSGEEQFEWRGRRAQAPSGTDSPQAMDIDSPPAATSAAAPTANGARNIPVEPSRPEWRSGDGEGRNGEHETEKQHESSSNGPAQGSEDTEEFRASLADLKNVAPFARQQAGLSSFSDLKDNLPFESKASSNELPMQLPKTQRLLFPTPPEAPRLPPTVSVDGLKPNASSWNKYLEDFEAYMRKWDTFNGQVVDHFSTRQHHVSKIRATHGYSFLGSRADVDVQEYYNWIQQDNDVRKRWIAACESHEQRYREFMAFREKMKQSDA